MGSSRSGPRAADRPIHLAHDHLAKRAGPSCLSDQAWAGCRGASRDRARVRGRRPRPWCAQGLAADAPGGLRRRTMHGGPPDEGPGAGRRHPGRKTGRATLPDKAAPGPLDRVDRQFRAPAPTMLWVSDFTCVATWQGFVHVASVIDAQARRIVASSAGGSAGPPRPGSCSMPWSQAVHQRRPARGSGLARPSDRGSQDLAIRGAERLAGAGIEPLVGSVGDSYHSALGPRRSTGSSRPGSSIAAGLGAASRPSSTPRSSGSTGSTPAACSSLSGTFRPQRPKRTTPRLWGNQTWPRRSNQSASGRPGAVRCSIDAACGANFDIAVAAAGFDPIHEYEDRWLPGEPAAYRVEPGFPRIVPGDFQPGPVGVSYDLPLSACEPWRRPVGTIAVEICEGGVP